MKHTDAVEVLNLAKDLISDVKAIENALDELSTNLKSLKGSFLDSAIDDVDAFVKGIDAKTKNAINSTGVIASQLMEYADLLIAGKGTS